MRKMRSTRYWGWLLWMAIILSAIAHSQMAVSLIPGDVTGDNWVDDGDLLAILSSFGDANPNLDITSDGIVDDADLLSLANVLKFIIYRRCIPYHFRDVACILEKRVTLGVCYFVKLPSGGIIRN
jgi:hypothetical protein